MSLRDRLHDINYIEKQGHTYFSYESKMYLAKDIIADFLL